MQFSGEIRYFKTWTERTCHLHCSADTTAFQVYPFMVEELCAADEKGHVKKQKKKHLKVANVSDVGSK